MLCVFPVSPVLFNCFLFITACFIGIRRCVIQLIHIIAVSLTSPLVPFNCRLSGTQPLCYCKYLMLSDCRMDKSDLSFEKSDAFATLTAPIISIKNLRSGQITVPEVGEIISDDKDAKGSIIIKPYIK